MTSREALINLRFNTAGQLGDDYLENNELINTIEKDLEVLEIFKRTLIDLELFNECMIECERHNIKFDCFGRLTKEEVIKIKEWLRNDKQ